MKVLGDLIMWVLKYTFIFLATIVASGIILGIVYNSISFAVDLLTD